MSAQLISDAQPRPARSSPGSFVRSGSRLDGEADLREQVRLDVTAIRREGLRMRKRCALYALCATTLTGAACPSQPWVSPIAFDTTTAWVRSASDSVSLLVEVAKTEGEQSFGMMERPSLDPGSGMIFLFDSIQGGDKGFWMYRTNMPLDIAFFDSTGVIVSILEMEPCEFQINSDACPVYSPGVSYWSALEVNRGWFASNGVRVGARLRLETTPE